MVKWIAYGLAALGAYLAYTKGIKTPLQSAITGLVPPK